MAPKGKRVQQDDDEARIVPTWQEIQQCQHHSCIAPGTNGKGYREGLVIRPSGDTKRTVYAFMVCDVHDFDTLTADAAKPYETVHEYFERTYQHALRNDPLVRSAATEEDKSLFIELLGKQLGGVQG